MIDTEREPSQNRAVSAQSIMTTANVYRVLHEKMERYAKREGKLHQRVYWEALRDFLRSKDFEIPENPPGANDEPEGQGD